MKFALQKKSIIKTTSRETCNKGNAKWWKKFDKLTGKDKSANISLTYPESQSVMNDKDTANYINSFFVGLTKGFPVVQDKWLVNDETESLPTDSRQSVANRLRELKANNRSVLNDPNVEILETFADFFAILLADIFNESFNSKYFPVIWKDFVVLPILKNSTVFRC